MKNRILVLILLIVLCFMFVGCKDDVTTDNDNKIDFEESNQPDEDISQKIEIVFNSNGSKYKTLEVDKDERIYKPKDPTKPNYYFMGWSRTLNGEIIEFPIRATKNITLYAVFESKKDRNKNAFTKYMYKQERIPAEKGQPERYQIIKKQNDLSFLFSYVPSEDKIIIFGSINVSGLSSIMIEWDYGKPNTLKGMIGHETAQTYDYAMINKVYLNSNNEMGSFIVGESTLNFNEMIEAFIDTLNLNVKGIKNEIKGCSSDFNLYLGN